MKADPTCGPAWHSLGSLAFDQRRYGAAEVAYREAIRFRPGFAETFLQLGRSLQALERGHEAAEAHRVALRIEPNNLLALINLANVLCEVDDPRFLNDAEAASRRAVELAPRLPQAIQARENVLRLQRRLDPAMASSQPADPGSSRSSFQQGLALLRQSRHDEAEACFRAALSVNPTMATSWVGLSQLQSEARGDRAVL